MALLIAALVGVLTLPLVTLPCLLRAVSSSNEGVYGVFLELPEWVVGEMVGAGEVALAGIEEGKRVRRREEEEREEEEEGEAGTGNMKDGTVVEDEAYGCWRFLLMFPSHSKPL